MGLAAINTHHFFRVQRACQDALDKELAAATAKAQQKAEDEAIAKIKLDHYR
jgi:hypothetical protein